MTRRGEKESSHQHASQLIVSGHLLLNLLAGDSIRSLSSELGHTAPRTLDRLCDSRAGAFHGAVFGFVAVEGTAHGDTGGFDLLSDG